jgi:hypothetical protein
VSIEPGPDEDTLVEYPLVSDCPVSNVQTGSVTVSAPDWLASVLIPVELSRVATAN